ncbi:MAG: hypothetical protein KGH62_05700, partial [Candidatus Micrarchaeota archaeon]|nr:hypothetical protein [Candidatus Micrarchaeota archaeon]
SAGALELTKEQYGQAVAKFPQLAGLSAENHTESAGALGLTKEQYGHAVAKFPQLAGLSVENYRQKTDWFEGHANLDAKELVMRFPVAFSYSLNQRIIPRYEYMKAKSDRDPFMILTVESFLILPDAKFLARLRREGIDASELEYLDFKGKLAL